MITSARKTTYAPSSSDATTTRPTIQQKALPARMALDEKLYRFHGFRLLDCHGKAVGDVDWIWADDGAGNTGQFIGVHLRWLRGTARVIPVRDLWIDKSTRTMQVAYTREQIKRAPRHAIDRRLTAEARQEIDLHYRLARPSFRPAGVTNGMAA